MDEELFYIRKAAKFLRVSVSTIRRWDDTGKLKSIRNPMNNYRMYRLKDLKVALNQITGC